ncbi:MAG: hypothetical protein VKP62_13330 [Candidatus Sericytochromatia bacterium]|nr:hypothetical protein [Candidatus Sericytochromatia bacterium]
MSGGLSWHFPAPPEVAWETLEATVQAAGITIERPCGECHPHHPEIIYPIDYGYVNGVPGEDGEPLDIFVGRAPTGLVAVARTIDHRKGDTELKLLWNCGPEEIYLVHGFLNFSPAHMTATLRLRQPLHDMGRRG